MKNKILIVGKGFIGTRLQGAFGCALSAKRIRSFKDAEQEIKKYNPAIIINCVGHTGKVNIDDCERDKDKTLSSNVFVPLMLAEAALRNKVKLIHISSGCIYHFDYSKGKPITEEKMPDFYELFYSRTKIYAERALEVFSQKFDVLILRIRTVLDNRPHRKNIFSKLLKYKGIVDVPNSVTYMPDFIKALRHLIKTDARGIYNVVNKGSLRYPELLDIYKKYRPHFKYKVATYKELGLVRPNLLLSTEKLQKSGFRIRNINEILEECVKNYLKY
ncbi:NAD-dependent epimerase/dehydratase family protein [bacterium]|nr:MAG: NAD-dependent epimerase/dehydratase family protein [bacterium]